MMEENYKPDGWLGILLGTKLWTDFTKHSLFDNKIEELCTRLGSVFKTVEPLVSPMYEMKLATEKKMTDDPFHGMFCYQCFSPFSFLPTYFAVYFSKPKSNSVSELYSLR